MIVTFFRFIAIIIDTYLVLKERAYQFTWNITEYFGINYILNHLGLQLWLLMLILSIIIIVKKVKNRIWLIIDNTSTLFTITSFIMMWTHKMAGIALMDFVFFKVYMPIAIEIKQQLLYNYIDQYLERVEKLLNPREYGELITLISNRLRNDPYMEIMIKNIAVEEISKYALIIYNEECHHLLKPTPEKLSNIILNGIDYNKIIVILGGLVYLGLWLWGPKVKDPWGF